LSNYKFTQIAFITIREIDFSEVRKRNLCNKICNSSQAGCFYFVSKVVFPLFLVIKEINVIVVLYVADIIRRSGIMLEVFLPNADHVFVFALSRRSKTIQIRPGDNMLFCIAMIFFLRHSFMLPPSSPSHTQISATSCIPLLFQSAASYRQ